VARVAISHVHLEQCPLFVGDFASVKEGTECNELVMKIVDSQGALRAEACSYQFLTQASFWGKTMERSRSRPR
jgi:hypothetical protein